MSRQLGFFFYLIIVFKVIIASQLCLDTSDNSNQSYVLGDTVCQERNHSVTIFLGIFWKRMNRQGAIAAMLVGLVTTFGYIYYFKFGGGTPDQYLFGVSPEGIGFVFMWLSAGVGIVTSLATDAPPQDIQDLVEDIRVPGTRTGHGMADAGMAPLSSD